MDPDALLSALKNRKLKSVAPPPEPALVVDDFKAPAEIVDPPANDPPPAAAVETISAFQVPVRSIGDPVPSVSSALAPKDDLPVVTNEVVKTDEQPSTVPAVPPSAVPPASPAKISALDQLRKLNAGASTPIRVNTSPISGLGLSQKGSSSASKGSSRKKGRDLDVRELDEDDTASQNSEPNVFVAPEFLSSGANCHTSGAFSTSSMRPRSPGAVRRSTASHPAALAATGPASASWRNRPQNREIIEEIIQLRESNTHSCYDIDSEIINNPHYSLDSLRRAGYPVQVLHRCGRFTGYAMKNDGNFTAKELLDSGCYLLTECKRVGYTAAEVKEAGLPLSALLLVGYDLASLVGAGFSLKDLRANQVKVADLRNLSTVHVKDLIEAGYTGVELRCAGYTATELVHFYGHVVVNVVGEVPEGEEDGGGGGTGVTYVSVEKSFENLKYLTDSGFNARDLKDAGYNAKELKSVGFSYAHVRGLGFSVQELVSSGYHQEIERQVLLELYTVTNGANWIHSFNWCVEGTELRDWYGITVEPFTNRVIRIALNNNNLTGTLPNSLSLLLSCQSLAFQNNYLDFDSRVISNLTLRENGTATVVKSPVKSPGRNVFGVASPPPPSFNRAVLNMLQLPQLQYINLQYNYEEGDAVAMHATTNSFDNPYHFELTTPFAIREFVEQTKAKYENPAAGLSSFEADNVSVVSGRSGATTSGRQSAAGALRPKSPASLAGSTAGPVGTGNDADDKQQKDALVALFYATNGHNWKNKKNWCKMNVPLHQWFGVTTNSHNFITKIELAHNNLKGTIPNEFFYLLSDFHDLYAAKFSYLSVLDLRYNSIHGPISTNIISLRESLKELHLHSNRFSGNAFDWLPQLTQLVHVDLKNNQFADHLTEVELQQLSELRKLNHLNCTSNLQEYDIPVPGSSRSNMPPKPLVNKARIVNAHVKALMPWCTIVTMLK